MKIPLSWLGEYVDLDGLAARDIADRLTFSGLEIEGIATVGFTGEGVVAAVVTAVRPHPKADKLRLVTVEYGAAAPLEVVCGAPNVRVGMKAAFAPAGVTLPNGLTIRTATIRGVSSSGMLCAEDELGLSDDHAGLFELPADAEPGAPLARVLGPPETVLTAEVTPNRPDCLSLIGVARELGALLGRPVRRPPADIVESGAPAADRLAVAVEDAEGCPRYTARLLTGVRIGPSPAWMRKRLERAGVRAINNVVDITNYVMLECGQPLHAFDLRRLRGGRLVVRRARPGETMMTLDGTDRRLTPEMLAIADGERPVALAGIMGGEESGVADDTAEVVLESAYFQPALIRRTCKALGMSSESAYRFERGADVAGADWASRRAAALLAAHAGAAVAPGAADLYPAPPEKRRISLRFARARALLGMDPGADTVTGILEALGMTVAARDAGSVTVECPSFRVDLEREADLIEEVARIHGLDKIPAPAPAARLVPGADDRPVRARMAASRQLAALGFTEIMNYSFTSDKLLNLMDPQGAPWRVRLPNPISADQAVLRPSLLPQLVETLGRNRARQRADAALFEAGRVYLGAADGGWAETDRVALGLMGRPGGGAEPGVEACFARMKGALERLCEALRFPAAETGGLRLSPIRLEPADWPWAEPGLGMAVTVAGRPAGAAGILRDSIAREWRITDPVVLAELDVEPLTAHVFRNPRARPIPAFPSIERDVALIVPEAVGHTDVLRAILQAAPPELRNVRLFDVFRGEHVGPGRKSMAYALTYQADDKTLTDEQANDYHNRIKAGIARDLQAEIRE